MDIALTREQVRQVDRIALEEYGIHGLVLMENAGRNAAAIIRSVIDTRKAPDSAKPVERVLILCGTGNNGGDGFVIARHLVNASIDVQIALAGDMDRLSPDAAANGHICEAMGIPIVEASAVQIRPTDLLVDALLGTGFVGQMRSPLADVINKVNAADRAGVVAIDVPSGLDCNTGAPSNATIVADMTITFVADKVGFRQSEARPFVGQVHVVDIGAPPNIIQRVLSS